jgi:hypothetical protein
LLTGIPLTQCASSPLIIVQSDEQTLTSLYKFHGISRRLQMPQSVRSLKCSLSRLWSTTARTLQTRTWLPVQRIIPCSNTTEENTFLRCYSDTTLHSKLTVPATGPFPLKYSFMDYYNRRVLYLLISKSRHIHICHHFPTTPIVDKNIIKSSLLNVFAASLPFISSLSIT